MTSSQASAQMSSPHPLLTHSYSAMIVFCLFECDKHDPTSGPLRLPGTLIFLHFRKTFLFSSSSPLRGHHYTEAFPDTSMTCHPDILIQLYFSPWHVSLWHDIRYVYIFLFTYLFIIYLPNGNISSMRAENFRILFTAVSQRRTQCMAYSGSSVNTYEIHK